MSDVGHRPGFGESLQCSLLSTKGSQFISTEVAHGMEESCNRQQTFHGLGPSEFGASTADAAVCGHCRIAVSLYQRNFAWLGDDAWLGDADFLSSTGANGHFYPSVPCYLDTRMDLRSRGWIRRRSYR